MNDISHKRHLPTRGQVLSDPVLHQSVLRQSLLRGPVLAAMLFALAYGSVMVLVIAPRNLLGGAQSGATDEGIPAAGDAVTGHPQLLRAGFSPLPGDRVTYGISD